MTIDKLSLLRVFSLTGRFGRECYYKNLLLKLEEIDQSFSKPTVRFKTIIWELYNCLSRGPLPTLEEDIGLFRHTDLALNTISSELALELTNTLLTGERNIRLKDHFKKVNLYKPIPILDWFSNSESANQFIKQAIELLRNWCYLNPREQDGFNTNTMEVIMSKTLTDFLSGRDFKLVVNDLITLVKFNLEKEIGLLND